MSRSSSSVLGLLSLAALGWLGLGGAAAAPSGWLLGVPGAPAAALLLAGLAGLAWLTRSSPAPTPLAASAGLGSVPLLLALGIPLPGLAALSGPPLFALLLCGVVLLAWQTGLRPPRAALFPVLLLFYMSAAARVQSRVGPEGDEPHYLMVAESLLRDGDVSLEQDYAEGRYAAFYGKGALEPHYRVRGKHGEIFSLHAVGLSLLVLPAYAAFGYAGASFFMALLLALVVLEIRKLVELAAGSAGVAEGVAWLVGLTPPLVHYAGLVFSEVPAALLAALAMRLALGTPSGRSLLLAGAAIAALPWLNVRYAALAAVLGAYALAGRPRPRGVLALALLPLASAAAIAAYHWSLYGFLDPRRVYGARPELSLALLPEGLAGLLLDQEFGLLAYSPVFAAAVPGLYRLGRERPRLGLCAIGLVAATLVLAGSWQMWRGGWNPPARFLVPVVPALALGVAQLLRRGPRAGVALIAGFSLWIGLAGALEPQLVHRDRDGTAPLFRAASGALEWTRLLPAYVLEDPDRRRLALVWAVALAGAVAPWPALRRVGLPGRTAGATLGLLVAVGTAAELTHSKSQGRDAVRLLGLPAIAVPGWHLERQAPAEWGPAELSLGPLYEPHRHPEGAVLGSRLRLTAGSYRLTLRVEALGLPATWGSLVVEPETSGPGRAWPLAGGPTEGQTTLEVRAGSGPLTLRVAGGSPFVLRGIRLARSTFSGAGGLIW